jgi:hypothetical protein
MKGYAYDFLAILHAVTVIFTLLWLPFGKFFHIFQRPAQLGVSFYKDVGARTEPARCRRCRHPFTSRMHAEDLIAVERELGYRYEVAGDVEHYQWICPSVPARDARDRTRTRLETADRRDRAWCRRRLARVCQSRPRKRPARRRGPATTITPEADDGRDTPDAPRHHQTFGPHRSVATGTRLDSGSCPTGRSKTHCCFCGQQCGMQRLVKDEEVVGFEPWMEFPFNQGKLCPKGVKRYLQGAHPDRLLHALRARPVGAGRFPRARLRRARSRAWPRRDRAHPRAARPRRVRVLGGASLTTEKTYLLGKFARMCLRTSEHRLQRPPLHGERGGGQQEGLRDRPRREPVAATSCRPASSGSAARTSAECAADHDRLRLAGTRERREGRSSSIPRITPIARTCDLFLPVKPGRDVAAVQRRPPPDDRERLDRPRVRTRHTSASPRLAAHEAEWTPARTAEVTGIAERAIRQAGEWWGTAKTSFLMHARGIEHQQPRRAERASARSTSCSPRAASAARLRLRDDHGQGNGQADASTARSAISSPAGATSPTPSTARHVAKVWGIAPEELPGPGVDCYEIFRKVERGEIRGLLVDLVQPARLAAGQRFRAAHAREARVLRRDRLLPDGERAPRRRRAPRLAARGRRGRGRHDGGPRDPHPQGDRVPPGRRARTGASSRTSRAR